MRIAICDDDAAESRRISDAITRLIGTKQHDQEITVDVFAGGDALLRGMQKQGGFDLILLDILMPGRNGLELAQDIRRNGDDCKIIFLTSSPEFAVDSYRVNAFYYLLKPFSEAEFAAVIDRALSALEDDRNSGIIVKSKGKIIRLRLSAIRYVESVNHTIIFHMRDGGLTECFSSLNEFHGVLLSDRRFVKCHKSFIVNMDYVSGISGKDFNLAGNMQVPISRNVYQQVKSAYFDYFFEKRSGS